MAHTLQSLADAHNSLAPHYSLFRVHERLLLTGHSHQAWPDVARAAADAAFMNAADHMDDKWQQVEQTAQAVRAHLAAWLGDEADNIVLCSSTLDALARLFSALPMRQKRTIVTTDGEFHSARRLLQRLEEEGLRVVRVPTAPIDTLTARMAEAVEKAAADLLAVVVSTVMYENSYIVPSWDPLLESLRALATGAPLVLDTYHHIGVLPFAMSSFAYEHTFVVGGGYKYLQLGEGNCFLRVPPLTQLRPVLTGWFAEFDLLHSQQSRSEVNYPRGPARWATATFDPTSHWRARAVLEFFAHQQLDAIFLRAVSVRQKARLRELLAQHAAVRTLFSWRDGDDHSAGFLALNGAAAGVVAAACKARGLRVDSRGQWLRLGPAPYVSDVQLELCVRVLAEACVAVGGL